MDAAPPIEVAAGGVLDDRPAYAPLGGPRLAIGVRRDRFGLWGQGTWFPHLRPEWPNADPFGVPSRWPWELPLKDLSPMSWEAAAGFEFVPVDGTVDGWAGRFSLALRLGFGVMATDDDLDFLQCQADPLCEGTDRQVHPDSASGLRLTVSPRPSYGLSFTVDDRVWIETIEGMTPEMHAATLWGADLSFRFGG